MRPRCLFPGELQPAELHSLQHRQCVSWPSWQLYITTCGRSMLVPAGRGEPKSVFPSYYSPRVVNDSSRLSSSLYAGSARWRQQVEGLFGHISEAPHYRPGRYPASLYETGSSHYLTRLRRG